jgi:hypothetical protein
VKATNKRYNVIVENSKRFTAQTMEVNPNCIQFIFDARFLDHLASDKNAKLDRKIRGGAE